MDNQNDMMFQSIGIVPADKSARNVGPVSSRGVEQDFQYLSQRLGSTSTPFHPRILISNPCESSLEDSAICMGSFDQTSRVDDVSTSEWSIKPAGLRRKSSPLPQHRRPCMDLHHHSLSYESLCLATESRRVMPCLHCSRLRSHSDSELFDTCKHFASEDHLFDCLNLCAQCVKNGLSQHELPSLSISSKSDMGTSIQDMGYHSNCSKEQASVEKLSNVDFSTPSLTSTNLVTNYIPSTHLLSSSGPSLQRNKRPAVKPFFSPLDRFHSQLLSKYAPPHPDRLIGRKMGLVAVDFISELQDRDLSHPISLILNLLASKDLLSASKVSDRWKLAVQSDQSANKRLQGIRKRQKQQKLQKENNGRKTTPDCTRITGSHGPLTEVQQNIATSNQTKNSETKTADELFKKYWKEAEHLKNEEALRKCPKCRSPARTQPMQDRACCTKLECKYDFCIRCRQPFHGSKDCAIATTPKKQPPPSKVGGRKSKMNLRRL